MTDVDVHNATFRQPTGDDIDAFLKEQFAMTDTPQTSADVKPIRAALERPFPPGDIKQRKGGRGKMLDYLDGATVIRRLMEASDAWEWRITDARVVDTYRVEYTDRNSGQVTGGKSDPTPTLMVVGELTIPGLGTRAGIGVTTIEPGAGEDNLKGASTDALKKAATLFGVGLDLYEDTAPSFSPYGDDHYSSAPAHAGPPQRPARISQVQSPQNGAQAPQRPPQRVTDAEYMAGQGDTEAAPPPAGGPPASEKQVNAVFAIAKRAGANAEAWAVEAGADGTERLSKQQASWLIEKYGSQR